jgi:Ca2+-binding EF-hand superfamily protein
MEEADEVFQREFSVRSSHRRVDLQQCDDGDLAAWVPRLQDMLRKLADRRERTSTQLHSLRAKSHVHHRAVSQFGEMFSKLDQDGSGTLSLEQFSRGMSLTVKGGRCPFRIDAPELDEIWHRVDEGDGRMNFPQMMQFFEACETHALHRAFGNFERGGVLHPTELRPALLDVGIVDVSSLEVPPPTVVSNSPPIA